MHRYLPLLTLFFAKFRLLEAQGDGYGFTIRNPIGFPPGYPFMGWFAAIALPLDLPGHRDIFLSVNVEAHYLLPQWNETFLTYPPIIAKRSLMDERKTFYDMVERKLRRFGYNGKACLLRAICEAAQYSLKDGNGVLGDILHIILTPSASKYEGIESDYSKAENNGKTKSNCKMYKKKCTFSLLDWISLIRHEVVQK